MELEGQQDLSSQSSVKSVTSVAWTWTATQACLADPDLGTRPGTERTLWPHLRVSPRMGEEE